MGDERTYDYTVALRAVETTDFMTGVWSKIPYEILDKAQTEQIPIIQLKFLYLL